VPPHFVYSAGVQKEIASSTGTPQPSCAEQDTYNNASLYSVCSSGKEMALDCQTMLFLALLFRKRRAKARPYQPCLLTAPTTRNVSSGKRS
jgi:hypothetical protein